MKYLGCHWCLCSLFLTSITIFFDVPTRFWAMCVPHLIKVFYDQFLSDSSSKRKFGVKRVPAYYNNIGRYHNIVLYLNFIYVFYYKTCHKHSLLFVSQNTMFVWVHLFVRVLLAILYQIIGQNKKRIRPTAVYEGKNILRRNIWEI